MKFRVICLFLTNKGQARAYNQIQFSLLQKRKRKKGKMDSNSGSRAFVVKHHHKRQT